MDPRIKTSLEALTEAIGSGDGEVLRREMAFLDSVVREKSLGEHPQLIHFLGNRSYAKALTWVNQAPGIPVGVCGGRAGQRSAKPGEASPAGAGSKLGEMSKAGEAGKLGATGGQGEKGK